MDFIFYILYFIFYIFLAVRRLEWAVMFLIAALPSYLIRFKIFDIPTTFLEVMILMVFLVWFLKNYKWIINNLKQKLEIRNLKLEIFRYPFDLEIILLLIISFIAAGVSGFSASAMGIWKAYFFEPVLLYIVVFNIITNKNVILDESGKSVDKVTNYKLQITNYKLQIKSKIQNIILWPLLVSALAVSFFAVYQKITGQFIGNSLWAAEDTRRVVSFFGYPNAVGLYLGPLILLFIGWLFSILNQFSIFQFFKIILIVFVVVLSVISIIFAKSVGALFGIATGLIVFGILAGKKIRIATMLIVIAAIISCLTIDTFGHKIKNYIFLNDFSGQVRKIQWVETWTMLKDGRIITGAGLANYQKIIKPYHVEGFFYNRDNDPDFHRKTVFNEEYRSAHWQPLEIYLYPHNIFLNFWSELGLAGILLFVWVIGKYFYLGISYLVIAGPDPQSRNMNGAETWIPGQARNDKKRGSLAKIDKLFIISLISAMMVIIIHGIVDVPYFKNDLAVMFWIFIAILSLIRMCPPAVLRDSGARESDNIDLSRKNDNITKV